MNVRDLIPWGRDTQSTPTRYREETTNPFLALHRDMNRLFDEAFRDFAVPSLLGRLPTWPSVEVSETDKDIRISAELPGMEEKDVEVLIEGDVLTLRGEKRSEVEDKARHFSERTYGRFERRIPLGFEADESKVQARFKNGVLTVTLPKPEEVQAKAKRIAINGGATAA